MSIVYTADIFCDGDGCSQWTHGATRADRAPTKGEARQNMLNGFVHINGKDYCRRCAKAQKEKPAQGGPGVT